MLCWAYCVLPGASKLTAPEVRGVAGAPLRIVPGADLALAISDVPAAEFGEDVLAERLTDPAWTAKLAMTHFDTVEALFAAGPVLPLRMCTVFRSAESALATVTADADTLSASLERVTGCAQWSVKVRGTRGKAADLTSATSGADYLRGVASARQKEAEQVDAARLAANRLHEQLSDHVVAAERDESPADGSLLAGAYLVRDTEAESFLDVTRRAEEGSAALDVDVRGPWAPYSFVPRLSEAA